MHFQRQRLRGVGTGSFGNFKGISEGCKIKLRKINHQNFIKQNYVKKSLPFGDANCYPKVSHHCDLGVDYLGLFSIIRLFI